MKLCDVHLFSAHIMPVINLTMLNADVINCHTTIIINRPTLKSADNSHVFETIQFLVTSYIFVGEFTVPK